MTERAARIARFLAEAGWGAAERRTLADDASFRRYDRLRDGERSAVLMDAPPPKEDVRPFLKVTRLLHGLDLSAPKVFAADEEAGLLLLEDFGDSTYTRLLAQGADESALYALAVDVLIHVRRRFAPGAADLPAYDEERLLNEAALLVNWFLPAIRATPTPAALRDEYLAAWRAVLPRAATAPATLVLRDFHVDNLIRLEGRADVASCGLLDYQDAVIGPSAYDLVSLVEDARRDVSPALAAAMTERYLAAFPAEDRAAFAAAAAILAAQRNAKIIGIFVRLCVRDGKAQYLRHIPRVWRLLEQDLRHPALAPVATWIDARIRRDERRIPATASAA